MIYPKYKNILLILSLIVVNPIITTSQNVFVVVIDGARYSETFGSENKYIPFIWNRLRNEGTIYTNFYNDGKTITLPGHSSILTGIWQDIVNDGTERPAQATIFEYFRKQKEVLQNQLYLVAGANKLAAVSYSRDTLFGSDYQASVVTNDYTGDLETYNNLMKVMETDKPRLVMVNFKQVDIKGHSGNWEEYLLAIKQVDSLIYSLWQKIETDDYYKNNTTMFITNDHGRHDDLNGGFKSHGCDCEGCRHIMLFGIGRDIPKDTVSNEKKYQVDLAPTVANLLSIDFPAGRGISLINSKVDNLTSVHINNKFDRFELYQNYPNPFNPNTIIKYSIPMDSRYETQDVRIVVYDVLGGEVATLVNRKQKPSNYEVKWNASDFRSGIYFYRLQAGDFVETKKMILLK